LLEADPEPAPAASQAPSAAPKKDAPLTAGWNGEHFFIRSPDGQFTISPYGYVDNEYRAYQGDGAPADTFVLRRARFGFQGSYGSHFDFALLTDAAATTGSVVRDVYLNVRIRPELQFQAGQFKTPFAQESGTGATNLDFIERGFQSMLYPSAASAYRSPGVAFHGDIGGGVMQYWIGAFNGKGYATVNTTNQAEVIGRLRFYPFRKSKGDWLKQLAFGGAMTVGAPAVFPEIKVSVARCPMALTPSSRNSRSTDPSSGTTVSLPTSSRGSLCAVNSINSICPVTIPAPSRWEGLAS